MRVRLLAFVALGSLMIGSSLAQSPVKVRGNGGSAPGCLGWLTMPSVQEELGLTPEQVDRGRQIAKDLREEWDRASKDLAKLPRPDQLKRRVTLADSQYEAGMKALVEFLSPRQVDRFDQILFQRLGPNRMLDPEIAGQLQLNGLQKDQLSNLLRESREELRKNLQASTGDSKALDEKEQKRIRDAHGRAVALLNDEQKRTWAQIAGPLFLRKAGETITP